MRRIAVIGTGGGGKSTLCRALGARLELPVREVGEVLWLPGWQRRPPTLLLFRTLKRVNAMRPQLLDLVTRNGRSAKLVLLHSPSATVRWLAEMTANTDRVVRDAR
jgi:adenylate kinase family enzyme